MKLPKIDLASLPDLDTLTGVFGTTQTPGHNDTVIVLATLVYDSAPPTGGLF